MGCGASAPIDLSGKDGQFTPEQAVGGAVTEAATALIVMQKFFSFSGVRRRQSQRARGTFSCHSPPQ